MKYFSSFAYGSLYCSKAAFLLSGLIFLFLKQNRTFCSLSQTCPLNCAFIARENITLLILSSGSAFVFQESLPYIKKLAQLLDGVLRG